MVTFLNTINQAYNSMKDKGEAFVESCKGVWADVLKETTLLIQKTKEKMVVFILHHFNLVFLCFNGLFSSNDA